MPSAPNLRHEYKPGDNWQICDRCGEKHRRSEMRKEWTNLVVCISTCWDPPAPQLFAPNVWPEGLPVPDARPNPPPIFVDVGDVEPGDL